MLEDDLIDSTNDPRHPKTVNADLMVDEIREVATHCKEMAMQITQLGTVLQEVIKHSSNNNTQYITHKHEGANSGLKILLAIAIVGCVATWFGYIDLRMAENKDTQRIEKDLGDHKAWLDIYGNKISKLEAKSENK